MNLMEGARYIMLESSNLLHSADPARSNHVINNFHI